MRISPEPIRRSAWRRSYPPNASALRAATGFAQSARGDTAVVLVPLRSFFPVTSAEVADRSLVFLFPGVLVRGGQRLRVPVDVAILQARAGVRSLVRDIPEILAGDLRYRLRLVDDQTVLPGCDRRADGVLVVVDNPAPSPSLWSSRCWRRRRCGDPTAHAPASRKSTSWLRRGSQPQRRSSARAG